MSPESRAHESDAGGPDAPTTSGPAFGSTAELFAAMDALAKGLRTFLAVLESEAPESEHLMRSWSGCQESFEALQVFDPEHRGIEDESVEEFERRLEDLQRMNAVVTAAVGRERDQLIERLALATQAGKGLGYYGAVEPSGSTCDVAG